MRHGIVGEQAEVRITAIGPKRRFYFADVVSVPVPSLARRPHPWIQADALATDEERAAATGVPELLGGMEYGHISLAEQRRYKTDIVRTQINRLGGLPLESPLLTNLIVEELPLRDNNEGLSWRTRVRYNVTKDRTQPGDQKSGGKKSPAVTWHVGMHPYRASQPVPVVDFPLAAPELRNLELEKLNLRGVREVEATVSSRGRVLLQFIIDPRFSIEEVAKDIEQQAADAWGLLAKRKISPPRLLPHPLPPRTRRRPAARRGPALRHRRSHLRLPPIQLPGICRRLLADSPRRPLHHGRNHAHHAPPAGRRMHPRPIRRRGPVHRRTRGRRGRIGYRRQH